MRMRTWIASAAPAALALLTALTACSNGSGSDATSSTGGGPATSSTGDASSGTGGASSGTGGEASTSTGGGTSSGGGSSSSTGAGGAGAGGSVWGPEQCPAAPPGVNVGFAVGDQVGEIVVKDCDGNDVSLSSFCGAGALFVFAAYGWCPLCQNVSAQQEALTDSFAGQNVASLNIIIQNGQAQPPDANYCKVWRDNLGHEDVVTLYDPTGAVLALWNGGGSSSYSAFIDSARVIVSTLEHNGDLDAIKAGIEGALAH